MRIKSIASGSSGNAAYIGTDNTHILVDCGISRKRITEGLKEAGLSLEDIDAILITHEHADHIASVGVIERTRKIPLYATRGTFEGICAAKGCGDFEKGVFNAIGAGQSFSIGDITIRALPVLHDAAEPVCFRFDANGKSAAIVTDLGDFDETLVAGLQGLNGIIIEANHDIRMLEAGRYPYPVKQRILGRYGHLSNERGGQLLNLLLNDGLSSVTLGHISTENNTRELARLAVAGEIDRADNPYRSSDWEIMTASQNHSLELTEL